MCQLWAGGYWLTALVSCRLLVAAVMCWPDLDFGARCCVLCCSYSHQVVRFSDGHFCCPLYHATDTLWATELIIGLYDRFLSVCVMSSILNWHPEVLVAWGCRLLYLLCNWVSVDVYRISVDVCRISVAVYRICVDVYRISIDMYRISVDVYRISVDVYRISVAVYKISIDVYRISVDVYRHSGCYKTVFSCLSVFPAEA